MLGYSKDEIINMPVSTLYENKQLQQDNLSGYLKNLKSEVRFENRSIYFKKNGSRLLTDVVVTVLVNKENNSFGFMLVLREIAMADGNNKKGMSLYQPLVVA